MREQALLGRWTVPITHHDRRRQDPDINILNPYKSRPHTLYHPHAPLYVRTH